MKVWVVYFRGEREYATQSFEDAADRAQFLAAHYEEAEVRIMKEDA